MHFLNLHKIHMQDSDKTFSLRWETYQTNTPICGANAVLWHPAHQTRHDTKSSEENSLPLFSVLIQWDETLLVHVSSFCSLSLASISTALRPLRTFILQGFPVSPTTLRKNMVDLSFPNRRDPRRCSKTRGLPRGANKKGANHMENHHGIYFIENSSKQVFYNLKESTKNCTSKYISSIVPTITKNKSG